MKAIVCTRYGAPEVLQLHRGLSSIPLDHDGILTFAERDPDLAPLLNHE